MDNSVARGKVKDGGGKGEIRGLTQSQNVVPVCAFGRTRPTRAGNKRQFGANDNT